MPVPHIFAAGTGAPTSDLDDNFAACLVLADANTLANALNHAPSVVLASATTINIGAAASNNITISGNVTINAFDTIAEGVLRLVTFTGTPTLTYNGTSMQLLNGVSRAVNAGDSSLFKSLGGGNWKEILASKIGGYTLVAEQASTSGTSIDFTGIPSWVSKVHVMFNGVSTNGTSLLLIQIGSGSVVSTGYLSASALGGASISSTAGFLINSSNVNAVISGVIHIQIQKASSFTWVAEGSVCRTDTAGNIISAGRVSVSAALDRVRITTVNGTDAFDAGAISIAYE